MCSNLENERVICAVNAKTHEQQKKMQYSENRLMWSEGISRPIPRTEISVNVEIARKIHANRLQKRNPDGLFEVLAPGSTVGEVSPTTSVIKEPINPKLELETQISQNSGLKANNLSN